MDRPISQVSQGLADRGTAVRQRPWWSTLYHDVRTYPQLGIGAVVLLVLIGTAVLAPVIAPYLPTQTNTGPSLQGPTAEHLFGTDRLGRDIFSRVLYGGRVSLFVSLVAVLISMVVGVVLGMVSGYRSGMVDSVIMRIIDGLMAFPGLILALTVAFALGPSVKSIVIALAVVRIPAFARVVRGQVLSLRHQEYVMAATVVGAGELRILVQHLLPNLTSIILVQVSLSAGTMIFTETSLGFLGLSVPPPTPTWGGLLFDGYAYFSQSPWQSILPGAVIFLAILSFNFLGDGLRDRLDPQQRRRRRVRVASAGR